jgi:glycosidase
MSNSSNLYPKSDISVTKVRVNKFGYQKLGLTNFKVDNNGYIILDSEDNLITFSNMLNLYSELSNISPNYIKLYSVNDVIRILMVNVLSERYSTSIIEKFEELADSKIGRKQLDDYLSEFEDMFDISGTGDQTINFEDLLQFWFNNNNPGHKSLNTALFDNKISGHELISQINSVLIDLHIELPVVDGKYIFEFLTMPEKLHPESIPDQIEYIINKWNRYLEENIIKSLTILLDTYKEEIAPRIGGSGPNHIPSYSSIDGPANYSTDQDWMSNLVLQVKNTYIWLNQLSDKFGKDIKRLDQIPEEEFVILKSRGITGLWLIGLWERSYASKRIKELIGNTESISSAYSIYDYVISEDLGGNDAFNSLKEKAAEFGINIGTDMVANHTGIVSKKIKDHPEWFISTKSVPYASYSFKGENVSNDPDYEIYLEDHYYDKTDAAVVFKKVDTKTDEVEYVYHGNDGTSYPWNDTAQLDFLKKEVRQAVSNDIIEIAKQFPIIRFDAAMVLTREHIQRLWYPLPTEGGAIPSRARSSLTQEEFDAMLPDEFWKEVVDRVNREVPDTLLIAEAFWLLEGYFVRNLGMHRVYNSAFMKMLQAEENEKYKQVIKNTIAYDPQILKRFVNYLSNPDEETAIKQFGADDKYFGTFILLATLPGLPMISHGQFEGLTEKYGMDYNKPKLDENINEELLQRHNIEIVPLLKKRYLYNDVTNFRLFDFITFSNVVDENVICYSNRVDNEKTLVLFNNKYQNTVGWIKDSVDLENTEMNNNMQQSLLEALGFDESEGYLVFTDKTTGLTYIRSKSNLMNKGLFIELNAFKYHVFEDFTEKTSNFEIWKEVMEYLGGKGTEDIKVIYQQMHEEFTQKEETPIIGEISHEEEILETETTTSETLIGEYHEVTNMEEKKEEESQFEKVDVISSKNESESSIKEEVTIEDSKESEEFGFNIKVEGEIDDEEEEPEATLNNNLDIPSPSSLATKSPVGITTKEDLNVSVDVKEESEIEKVKADEFESEDEVRKPIQLGPSSTLSDIEQKAETDEISEIDESSLEDLEEAGISEDLIGDMKENIGSKDNTIKDLEAKIRKLEETNQNKDQIIKDLESEVVKLQKKEDEYLKEIDDYVKEFNVKEDDLNRIIMGHQDRIEQLNKELHDSLNEIERLKSGKSVSEKYAETDATLIMGDEEEHTLKPSKTRQDIPTPMLESSASMSTTFSLINRVIAKLSENRGGMKLRVLAMTLGVNPIHCKECIELLEEQKLIEVIRKNESDDNPTVRQIESDE